MNRTSKAMRITVILVLLVAAATGVYMLARQRGANLTLAFTREDLQSRIAPKFPFDQKLLFIIVTYANPQVILDEGSDRLGLRLDASAKLDEGRLAAGELEGSWQVRYDPQEGALFFDDPKVERFDIERLSPSTREMIARVATPLVKEYLQRVPVYKLKPGDLRQDIARAVLKSVTVRQGKLLVVVGPP